MCMPPFTPCCNAAIFLRHRVGRREEGGVEVCCDALRWGVPCGGLEAL